MQNFKTVIYIDAANILLSAENLNFNLDIFKLLQHLKDKITENEKPPQST